VLPLDENAAELGYMPSSDCRLPQR
jgi:hypothetical protein